MMPLSCVSQTNREAESVTVDDSVSASMGGTGRHQTIGDGGIEPVDGSLDLLSGARWGDIYRCVADSDRSSAPYFTDTMF